MTRSFRIPHTLVLLFGINQAWHGGQKEVTVQLTDRIILSPHAAKRLSILLGNLTFL
jgi:hypothetical protein